MIGSSTREGEDRCVERKYNLICESCGKISRRYSHRKFCRECELRILLTPQEYWLYAQIGLWDSAISQEEFDKRRQANV